MATKKKNPTRNPNSRGRKPARREDVGIPCVRDELGPQPAGRPVALCIEGQDRLLEAVARGGSREDAAHYADISPSTLFRYLRAGRTERREAKALDPSATPPDGSCWQLLEGVKRAEAAFRLSCIENITLCSMGPKGQWQASAWLLERKFPSMFGRVSRVDVAGSSEKSPGGKGDPVHVQGGGVVVLPALEGE